MCYITKADMEKTWLAFKERAEALTDVYLQLEIEGELTCEPSGMWLFLRKDLPRKYSWEHLVAQMKLTSSPACCGVVEFSDVFIPKDLQGRGLGKLLLEFRETLARSVYAAAVAVVLCDNAAENHILESAGWTRGVQFRNWITRTDLRYWHKTFTGD